MQIIVTARHCEISPALRQHAEGAVRRAAKAAHRPQRADVVFDADHGRKLVELILNLPRGKVRIASAEANDFRTALDRAVRKLKSQLDKDSGKPRHVSSST
jgi:ribosomal subunit interface protein